MQKVKISLAVFHSSTHTELPELCRLLFWLNGEEGSLHNTIGATRTRTILQNEVFIRANKKLGERDGLCVVLVQQTDT